MQTIRSLIDDSQKLRQLNAGKSCNCGTCEDCMAKKKTVKAGGPGSGRHPESGTFSKTGASHGKQHNTDFYVSKKGQGDTAVVHYQPTSAKRMNIVHEYSNTAMSKGPGRVFRGPAKDTQTFLSERYGIK